VTVKTSLATLHTLVIVLDNVKSESNEEESQGHSLNDHPLVLKGEGFRSEAFRSNQVNVQVESAEELVNGL
jgi:hypothetical protein